MTNVGVSSGQAVTVGCVIAVPFVSLGLVCKLLPAGSLWVFPIPKSRTSEVAYRSHPLGLECKCHPLTPDRTILDAAQSDRLPEKLWCSHDGKKIPPTWRLLTSRLQPTNDQPNFLLTPISKVKRKSIKEGVNRALLPLLEYALNLKEAK